jgi:hypothetical protein
LTARRAPDADARHRWGVIADEQARVLSSIWASPSNPLPPLADVGAITSEAAGFLRRLLHWLRLSTADVEHPPVTTQAQLVALLTYVEQHGERGPMPGGTASRARTR